MILTKNILTQMGKTDLIVTSDTSLTIQEKQYKLKMEVFHSKEELNNFLEQNKYAIVVHSDDFKNDVSEALAYAIEKNSKSRDRGEEMASKMSNMILHYFLIEDENHYRAFSLMSQLDPDERAILIEAAKYTTKLIISPAAEKVVEITKRKFKIPDSTDKIPAKDKQRLIDCITGAADDPESKKRFEKARRYLLGKDE